MISKFLSLAAAALLATTVMSHASSNNEVTQVTKLASKDVDGFRSNGIKNDNYKSLVTWMVKKSVCDYRTPSDFDANSVRSDIDAAHKATGIPRAELMIMAQTRANKIEGFYQRDPRMGPIQKNCHRKNEDLITFSSFANTRIPIDVKTRQEAKELSQQYREMAVDVITLRQTARNERCGLDDHERHIAMWSRIGLEDQIAKRAFDADYVVNGTYSRESLKSVFDTVYPGLTECEAGKKIIEKHAGDYPRDDIEVEL